MPHFIIECSESILKPYDEKSILKQIHTAAYATGLFNEADIKVRLKPFKTPFVDGQYLDFIHVFAHIMQGRTAVQKSKLSKVIVSLLTTMYPDIANIAMSVSDFDRDAYFNRTMIDSN